MADIDLNLSESLQAIPMFAGLDDVGLWHISQLATEFSVSPGHVLVQPGQEGAGLFVIVDGTVNVELPGGTTFTCSAGEFIGELSLLVEGLEHTGRVRATSAATCLAISRDDFRRMLQTYPQIAITMCEVLARRLAQTDEMLKARS